MVQPEKEELWQEKSRYFARVVDRLGMPIDAGIMDAVIGLNVLDVHTEASCEGHLERGCAYPWIRIGAPGTDELEEQFRQARPHIHHISEDERDQAWTEYHKLEKQLKSLHMQECDKVIMLLDGFYQRHVARSEVRLIITDYLSGGAFFLQSQGSARQDTRTHLERATKLAEYQDEMAAFAAFAKARFFDYSK